MASIRSQPATCKDGEMRSVAFHTTFQCKATTWKRRGVVARAPLHYSDFCSRMAFAT